MKKNLYRVKDIKILKSCDISIKTNEYCINGIKGIYIFLCNLLMIGIAYGILTENHYSPDTFSHIINASAGEHLQLGRIFSYFIMTILLNFLHINPAIYQAPFTLFLILSMAFCCTLLTKKICELFDCLSLKKLIAVIMAINISFINVYILEWYLFPEATIVFACGIITVTIAIMAVIKDQNTKNLLVGFLFLCVSINIYQINISFYVIFTLTFILLKDDFCFNKKAIKGLIWVIVIGISAGISNIGLVKALEYYGIASENSRSIKLTISSLVDHFTYLSSIGQYSIWISGSGFMPRFTMIIFGIISLSSLLYCLWQKKLSKKSIFYVILVIIINYSIIFAPHMLTDTIWLAPRTIVGIFLFISSTFLLIIKCYKKNTVINIIIVCMALFLLLNIFQIHKIIVNNYASNKIDKEMILLINNKIVKYEQDNNISITKIATTQDDAVVYGYYGNVDYISFDTNLRVLAVPWSDVNAISYYTGRNFQKIPMDELIYEKYFKNKNWSCFNPDEQMVFVGDILYMAVY